ncbi:MCE family protein [Nocardioides acrostichi]|uniref:MCE family protein n=1 Tax=Nocardioides acrostichi TaxID=2784339 RepID=A0A930V163_9ACTN|nr:MCE family protein [Nocardioides acrostichi]MBF4162149.1 MCE family protein [Nocardioides acrostichi]
MSALDKRNREFYAAAVKLTVFTVVSLLVTGLLAVIMGNIGFGDTMSIKAVFTDASSVKKGDDVRVAGVNVGEVTGVDHYERTQALVTFNVDSDVPLTTGSTAAIRFLNLVGDRYLALDEGTPGDPLEDGDTMPVQRTKPALDLTVLFNGFKPLFEALAPKQVNELSMNILQVLQGEGGTVQSLLARTASLTNTLANRDELIGDVITNLNTTVGTLDSSNTQLNDLIVSLRRWLGDLSANRKVIGSSLDSISNLSTVLADLLRDGRPLVKDDVAALRKLASRLNRPGSTKALLDIFDRVPGTMEDYTRTGSYGSWYNQYLCSFGLTIHFPEIPGLPKQITDQLTKSFTNVRMKSTAQRCAGVPIS